MKLSRYLGRGRARRRLHPPGCLDEDRMDAPGRPADGTPLAASAPPSTSRRGGAGGQPTATFEAVVTAWRPPDRDDRDHRSRSS